MVFYPHLALWVAVTSYGLSGAIMIAAYLIGYGSDRQVKRQHNPPPRFLSFLGNGAMWSDGLVINPNLIFMISPFMVLWPMWGISLMPVTALVIGWGLYQQLLMDSQTTPSFQGINGRPTVSGILHVIYFAMAMAACLGFYLLTPSNLVPSWINLVVTVSLTIHLGIAMLQPPLKVHGKIKDPVVWWYTVGGWVILWVMAGHLWQFY